MHGSGPLPQYKQPRCHGGLYDQQVQDSSIQVCTLTQSTARAFTAGSLEYVDKKSITFFLISFQVMNVIVTFLLLFYVFSYSVFFASQFFMWFVQFCTQACVKSSDI